MHYHYIYYLNNPTNNLDVLCTLQEQEELTCEEEAGENMNKKFPEFVNIVENGTYQHRNCLESIEIPNITFL